MLRSINEILGYKLHAKDGEIGKVKEFYFDDETWTIRYLIADTGNWLMSKKVLISPEALRKPDWAKKEFPVELTKEQVENSPDIDMHKPVSRQQEYELTEYYGWPYYWTGVGGGIPGAIPYPSMVAGETKKAIEGRVKEENDPHLRSTKETDRYNIQATDGEIGHIVDFIVEDETWNIRYIIVDTNKWLPGGKKVIIAVSWIHDIDWNESKVFVDLDKESVKHSPEFNPEEPVNREYEGQLFDYYGRPKYWE